MMMLSVVRCERQHASGELTEHTEYIVRVESAETSFTCRRRYSHFLALHQKVMNSLAFHSCGWQRNDGSASKYAQVLAEPSLSEKERLALERIFPAKVLLKLGWEVESTRLRQLGEYLDAVQALTTGGQSAKACMYSDSCLVCCTLFKRATCTHFRGLSNRWQTEQGCLSF